MAVAPYFLKTAAGGADILAGLSPREFTALLENISVGVSFDAAAATSFEGRCTLELVTNLLARLFPRISLLTQGGAAASTAATLAALARRINPNIDVCENDAIAACIAVGAHECPLRGVPTIYAGADNWIAKVSTTAPVDLGRSNNPFGAGAAACFATANLFRSVFAKYLQHGGLDEGFALSLIDYDPGASTPANDCPMEQDLGDCSLVGLGAIGNATVWALAQTEEVRGQLDLIDPEEVDETNPQRYVLIDPASNGRVKVELAREHLTNTRLSVRAHQRTWAEYLAARGNWVLPLVAVAVDTPQDRCAIQASLPRVVLNAWTQPADLGVSRHVWTNDQACLTCLYTPAGQRKSEETLIAEAIHYEGDIQALRTMLYHNTPLDADWIERIEQWMHLPPASLHEFAGTPLRTLYRRGICGGVILNITGERSPVRVEVPMAFQSALAGIMLAAELVLQRGLPDYPSRPAITRVDLLRPLAHALSEPERKHSGCICGDADYQAAFLAKYA